MAIGAQNANFEIQYDVSVGTAYSDLIVALSNAQATGYNMTSTPVRLDGTGNIDAINAATYSQLMSFLTFPELRTTLRST